VQYHQQRNISIVISAKDRAFLDANVFTRKINFRTAGFELPDDGGGLMEDRTPIVVMTPSLQLIILVLHPEGLLEPSQFESKKN